MSLFGEMVLCVLYRDLINYLGDKVLKGLREEEELGRTGRRKEREVKKERKGRKRKVKRKRRRKIKNLNKREQGDLILEVGGEYRSKERKEKINKRLKWRRRNKSIKYSRLWLKKMLQGDERRRIIRRRRDPKLRINVLIKGDRREEVDDDVARFQFLLLILEMKTRQQKAIWEENKRRKETAKGEKKIWGKIQRKRNGEESTPIK